MGFFAFAQTVSASANLEISNTADFSHLSTNFRGGEIIFVRLKSDTFGYKKIHLSIRDNFSNLVNSYDMDWQGNYYSVVIPAPYSEGLYSLEAQIEFTGSAETVSETIKVGNPIFASLELDVESNVIDNEILGEREVNDAIAENSHSLVKEEKSILQIMTLGLKEIFEFLWPFKSQRN